MIIHDSYRRPTRVRVVNSRLPVYEVTYGDGIGDVVRDLFTRIAPKAGPLAKQLSMKDVDVVRVKAVGADGDLAGKAFSAIQDRISRLIRRKPLLPVKLPLTQAMSANVSKSVNQAVNQKLAALVTQGVNQGITSKAMQDSVTANLIAGSGFQ